MVDFKKDAWLYALIAAVLGIIAVLTPWGSLKSGTTTIYSWIGGVIWFATGPALTGLELFGVTVTEGWSSGPTVVTSSSGLGLWTFGLTVASIAALLIYGVNNWRGNEFKWDWLIYAVAGILLFILPILTLILEGTSGAMIGFAPIGLIIAGIIAIGAFVVDKFLGGE